MVKSMKSSATEITNLGHFGDPQNVLPQKFLALITISCSSLKKGKNICILIDNIMAGYRKQ